MIDCCFAREENGVLTAFEHHDHMTLLTERNGAEAGCRTGLLYYRQTEYLQGGVHEDQEGFFVLEGSGSARVGEEEFPLEPGTCFLAPAGVYHTIKRNSGCPYVKLFYFHAAIDCGAIRRE